MHTSGNANDVAALLAYLRAILFKAIQTVLVNNSRSIPELPENARVPATQEDLKEALLANLRVAITTWPTR